MLLRRGGQRRRSLQHAWPLAFSVSNANMSDIVFSQPKDIPMTIAVGDKIPASNFVQPTADGLNPVASDAFFAGRRVALFSVPGAYTPTCSAKHLPGFVEKAAELKAKGIDEIACTAVNDAFVMGAWGKSSGAEGVTMLADGNGDFVKAIGLEMDGSKFGMGTRGQRFSMVVSDGVVEQLNVEGPGEFRVSTAEYMLEQL
jgi:glutaredoxin/glutathione-dependent peroxiredoxin